MSGKALLRSGFVAFGVWMSLPAAAWAQGVGGIGGTVTDISGAVLPGATVTLSSPGIIGGNQDTVTTERGTFLFSRLVPGRYSIRANLLGFRPAVQQDVIVNADVTVRVDLRLEVGTVEEAITVTGVSPLLDTTTALKQAVLTAETLQTLPNRIDVWGIANMIPSISLNKVDVGGSESFLQSTPVLRGASNQNAFMIDGMDVAWVNNLSVLYFDPYVYEETNYQLGGGSAEVTQGGIIFNMVTKNGTNAFHGGGMFAGANRSMGSQNASPELRAQLLAAVPPRALQANPDIVPGSDIQYIYDTGGWLSGPIVRDRLWFLAGWHTQALNQYILGSYNVDGTQVVDDNIMWNAVGKVSWQVSRASQISVFNNLQYKLIRYRNDDANQFVETRARNYNYKYPSVTQAKWTHTLTSRILIDAGGSLFYTPVDAFRPQPEVRQGDLARFDAATNTLTVARPTYNDPEYFKGVARGSGSFYAGAHQFKVGYSYNNAYLTTDATSLSNDMRAVFRNGVADSVNTYNTPVQFSQHTTEHAFFVQDRWTPFRKLTLNLGLRLEHFYAWQPAACQPETIWVRSGQCFAASEGVPDFTGAVPRFSAIYDLFGTGRTALKLSANRYRVQIGTSLVASVSPIRVTSDTRSWRDANGDLVPQVTELGPSTGFNLGTVNRFTPDLAWPTATEYAAEIQHQLPKGVVVSAVYTRRTTKDNIAGTNLAVPWESYIPLEVTEVSSGQRVTVYNQAPALRGLLDVEFDNASELDDVYDGLDLTIQKRMSDGWMLMGGASFGKHVGDIYCLTAGTTACTSYLSNPNFTYRRGIAGFDKPYTFRLSGLYQLPYAISLSGTLIRDAGYPEITTVLVSGATVSLTQVSQSLVVEPRATKRLPALNQLDLSIKRSWRSGARSFEPRLDIYNALNASTIIGRNSQLGPVYGQVSNIQRGRLIKIGFNMDF
jgi:hypothetical protein